MCHLFIIYILVITSDYNFSEWGVSLIYFNILIYIYLLFLLFSIMLLFDIKNFLTLNEFRRFSGLQFFSISIIFSLFSIAGLPPFLGFISKFLMFFFLIYKQGFFFLFFFTIINIFIIYFYIQNVRFLFTTSTLCFFYFKSNHVFLNFNLILLSVLFSFFNFFGILFSEDFLIYIDNICQYINF